MNLKSIRKEQKVKQEDLSKILNVSKAQISRIEKGISDISGHQIVKICNFLKCSSDELLGLK